MEDTIISYTITYSDSKLDIICGSTTIQPSSCGGGVCSDTFHITSSASHCPPNTDLNLTVSATSAYGNARLNQLPIKRGNIMIIIVNRDTVRVCTDIYNNIIINMTL